MSTTKKTEKPKAPPLFSDGPIDRPLAQVQNKDAESILGESGLAGPLKSPSRKRWEQEIPDGGRRCGNGNGGQAIPFWAYPPEVRKIIHPTNAPRREPVHLPRRKIVKNRGHFPRDEAASQRLSVVLRPIEKAWRSCRR